MPRDGRVVFIALAGITAAGALLRAWPVTSRPLWHDEVMTWAAVNTGLVRILTWTHHYEHPPLSYLFVWITTRVFGTEAEWALRLPSLLCGVAVIPAVFVLGRVAGGVRVGVAAAALAAFDYNQITQSAQARMYTLTVLATVLALCGVVASMRRFEPRVWAATGVALAAAYASSHMGSFVWIAIPAAALAWMFWRREETHQTPRATRFAAGLGIAYAVAFALCSVGFVVMASRFAWFRDKSGTEGLVVRLAGLWNDFWHAYGHPLPAVVMLGLGVAGIWLLVRRHRPVGLLMLALLVVNLLFVLPVQPHNFEPRPRYVVVGQIPLWIGAAMLLASLRPATVRVLGGSAAAATLAWTATLSLAHGEHWHYEFGRVVQRVRADKGPRDQVLFYPAWAEAVPTYYGLRPTHEAPPGLQDGWAGGSGHTDRDFRSLDTGEPTWLVATYLHTGARDWVDDKAVEVASIYGVAPLRERIAELAHEHAIVVVRVSRDGVTAEGFGAPEP